MLQRNIKERNKWGEANSPLFKDNKFLTTMEDVYKHEYLHDMEAHSELLVYDWSNGGEIELVVEDIERIGKSHGQLPSNARVPNLILSLQILIVSKSRTKN